MHQAYDTVTSILAAAQDHRHSPLVMACTRATCGSCWICCGPAAARAGRTVLRIGYGAGMLLEQVRNAGFPFAGIEISAAMQAMAAQRLGPEAQPYLHVGNFLDADRFVTGDRWSLVYWNDVFEHIHPMKSATACADLPHALARRAVGNDHTELARPAFGRDAGLLSATDRVGRLALEGIHAPRVRGLLRRAGFRSLAAPLVVSRGRMVLCGSGGLSCKCLLEPALEWLPFPWHGF